jgi:hypothetical protein
MACMKCGSDWVTLKGRNMVSCPECCKQQRCKARKQGRLPAVQSKPCERCGSQFALQGSAVSASRFCDDCRLPARNERRKRWVESNRKEVTRRRRVCRTLASFIADVRAAMSAQLLASRRSVCALSNPPRACLFCSKPFLSDPRHDSRFCSTDCAGAWSRDSLCKMCGERITIRAVGRDARKRLSSALCRRCAVRKWRATIKAKDSKRLRDNHRKRCRLHGVPYDPSVKSRLVFERDNYVCHVCGRQTLMMFAWVGSVPDERSPTIDHHPYPLSAGISGHEWHNVRCACWGCNVRKGATILPHDLCCKSRQTVPTGGQGQPCRTRLRKTRSSNREGWSQKSAMGVRHG